MSNNRFFGDYKYTSSLNSNLTNYNKGFRQNAPLIEKQNYINQHNTLHNNLSENLLHEEIQEYTININSNDRDLKTYPNPFNFTVTFGGSSNGYVKKDLSKKISEEYFRGSVDPIIDKNFMNVKYVAINYLILPNILDINLFKKEKKHNCSPYPYLIVKVKELESNKVLSTNNIISNNGFIFYPDQRVGENSTLWLSYTSIVTSRTTDLSNLSRLTFEILDPKGNLLKITNGDKEIDFKNLEDYCFYFENFISLTIGTIENELNTNINYRA